MKKKEDRQRYGLKSLLPLNKYILKYKYRFFSGLVFVFLANYFTILSAQYIRDSFNSIEAVIVQSKNNWLDSLMENEKIHDLLLQYILIIIGLALLRGFFLFLMRQTIILVSRFIEYDLKNAIYEHYQSLPQSFYRNNRTGDLMNRIAEDVSRVRMYFGPSIMYMMNSVSLVILVVYAMVDTSPKLAFFSLLPMPLLIICIYFISINMNKKSEVLQRKLSDISVLSHEVFQGIKTIRAYVRETYFFDLFKKQAGIYKIFSINFAKTQALFFPIVLFLIGCSTLMVVYIGGQEIIKNNITTGTIAEYIIYINQLTFPIMAVGWIVGIIQRAAVSQGRINSLLDVKNDIIDGTIVKDEILGAMKFENVSFTYNNTGIKAIDNMSFNIPAKIFTIICGPTGGGKTTVLELLLRIYDIQQGKVMIDNHEVKNYLKEPFKHKIAYGEQKQILFSDTIENNLKWTYAPHKKSLLSLDQCIEIAGLKKDIVTFKAGIQTKIGERGVLLSGGQKQRLCIARALYRQADLLVLDDVFSAIDPITEMEIIDKIIHVRKQKSTLMVTHRLAISPLAQLILYVDQGKVKEMGDFNTLMKLKSNFYQLYKHQQKKKYS